MKCSTELTQERLKELLNYNPETGLFIRKVQSSGQAAGKVAGTNHNMGYRSIGVNGSLHLAHRLAWLYMTGAWPEDCIDHIDGDKLNNRFDNLRPATKAENGQNRNKQANNKSGYKGVSWDTRSGKWCSSIYINKKRRHLGYFSDPKDAHEAYRLSAKIHHGQFANTGTCND